MNQKFTASWSGGKDSAMAVYKAVQSGARLARVWTMFEEEADRSRSHALPESVIRAQAERMGAPFMKRQASWETYEQEFIGAMKACADAGIENGVFGDIDLEDHRKWVQQACGKAGMIPWHPLWLIPRRQLLEEFIAAGFEAYIIVVDTSRMPERFLGQRFTIELMDELDALAIDSCGESGEFHTVVADGPIFSERVPLVFGERIEKGNYVFLPTDCAE
ncbi:diphthine--ammonia ligase [Sporosarcina sp. BI001-red]|uniref:Dph6-related ATP pyrophosphatase n=1 Tax=Sporosarcina sp. BI001-red TaxID=2282866 RepID=UPI000E22A25C|nr:diphthine--ammonia ligase [Sporosarcina sp. BI001-red]REB07831.1 diphthine--ammonia ligase [Sporosarcina sp. BI001-red]